MNINIIKMSSDPKSNFPFSIWIGKTEFLVTPESVKNSNAYRGQAREEVFAFKLFAYKTYNIGSPILNFHIFCKYLEICFITQISDF